MVSYRVNPVLVAAACVALVAHAVPTAFGRDCDRPCCEDTAHAGGLRAAEPAAKPAGGCPLCAGMGGQAVPESAQQPCGCRLDAREGQPLSASRTPLPTFDDAAWAVIPAMVAADAPRTLGVSREYLAMALAAPIRPPRILYGVWRN